MVNICQKAAQAERGGAGRVDKEQAAPIWEKEKKVLNLPIKLRQM